MRNTYWLQFSDVLLELYRISTTKPEVVITMRRYEIEMQFRHLDICFRGRQSQWNIDRHQVLYSSAWTLPIWKHGDLETGSSYNYASVRDRNAISASRYRFSSTPKSMEHRPTSSSAWILLIWKHGDLKTGSSYNYASVRDINTISASRYMFSSTPKSMEHRPTSSSV